MRTVTVSNPRPGTVCVSVSGREEVRCTGFVPPPRPDVPQTWSPGPFDQDRLACARRDAAEALARAAAVFASLC